MKGGEGEILFLGLNAYLMPNSHGSQINRCLNTLTATASYTTHPSAQQPALREHLRQLNLKGRTERRKLLGTLVKQKKIQPSQTSGPNCCWYNPLLLGKWAIRHSAHLHIAINPTTEIQRLPSFIP